MLILSQSQVASCTVLQGAPNNTQVLSGLCYQDKLFFLVKQVPASAADSARQAALKSLEKNQGQGLTLIVEHEFHLTVWQEGTHLTKCPEGAARSHWLRQLNLKKIATEMQGCQGVKIRNRRQGWKQYKDCFLAKDALKWLSQTYGLSSDESLQLAQRMMDEHIIYSLQCQSSFSLSHPLYRFYSHDKNHLFSNSN